MIYTPRPLPEPVQIDKHLPTGIVIRGYTAEQLSAYAAAEVARAVAAERERCAKAAEDADEIAGPHAAQEFAELLRGLS